MELPYRVLVAASMVAMTTFAGFAGGLGDAHAKSVSLAAATQAQSIASDDGTGPGFGMQRFEVAGTSRKALLSAGDGVNRSVGNRLSAIAGDDSAGGWLLFDHSQADLTQAGFSGAETDGNTLLAGFDRQSGAATFGAFAGIGDVDAALPEIFGRFKADRTILGLYGRAEIARAYLAGSLVQESIAVDMTVTPSIGGTIARSDRLQQARFELGLIGPIAPYAAVRFAKHKQGGFTEGDGFVVLRADADTRDLAYAEIGVRYSVPLQWTDGSVRVNGHGLYQRLLSDRDTEFLAGLTAPFGPFGPFAPERGQDLRQQLGIAGISVNYSVANDWIAFVQIEAEFDSRSAFGRSVGAGLLARF